RCPRCGAGRRRSTRVGARLPALVRALPAGRRSAGSLSGVRPELGSQRASRLPGLSTSAPLTCPCGPSPSPPERRRGYDATPRGRGVHMRLRLLGFALAPLAAVCLCLCGCRHDCSDTSCPKVINGFFVYDLETGAPLAASLDGIPCGSQGCK